MPETANDSILVTLLGTGCPIPLNERFGPSTLIEAGGLRLLFDCGRRITDNPIGQNVTILNHEHTPPKATGSSWETKPKSPYKPTMQI